MIGQTLSHYRIIGKLGEGGMGILYRAQDIRLDRDVAIKVLRPEALGDAARRRRFVQEAKAASALNHAHIVAVYDVGQVTVDGHDVDFIVMECLGGRNLDQVMAERRLGLVEALDCAVQIADALAAAHAVGIVHRDVKPANVMLSDAGRVKVLDFGLAKLMERDGPGYAGPTRAEDDTATRTAGPQTREGVLLGTAAYMSPEQAEGKPVDVRSDVFSLGSVLYEMFAGRTPFRGGSPASLLTAILRDDPPSLRSLRKDVPRDLERVLTRCLAKSPDGRYQSAGELLLDLVACRARVVARASGWRNALRQPRYVMPPVLVALALAAFLAWAWKRGAPVRWAREVALPEIDRLVAANDYYQAYWLAKQAQPYLPGNPQLNRFWKDRCASMWIRTNPPGADVFMKSYRAPEGEWKPVGRTPLEDFPAPSEMLRWRITKEGFEPVDGTSSGGGLVRPLQYTLDAKGTLPAGMVRVTGGPFAFRNHPPVELDDFWLDRYEVTNRAYKEFVDQGGYRKRDYWKQAFLRDGRTLSWEDAIGSFQDATARPGPASWELGTYPDGQGDYPVGGVSWFEAAAYAEFAGKALPTFYHWYKATEIGRNLFFADIIDFSNFRGRGPVAVGSLGGTSPFGSSDMAGNVREWCATESGRERYILGGSWNEPAHTYILEERLSPWSRLPVNGFRCVRYMAPLSAPLAAPAEWAWRNYSLEKPASDEAFRSYRGFYSYDPTDLKAVVEAVEAAEHWRHEKVSFDAAYGNERVPAHLFLPGSARPPYQTVVLYPSGEALMRRSSDDLRMASIDFIVRSGRAVLYPVYKGTYERRLERDPSGPNEGRDIVVQQVKDLRRSLDYLESRQDIDRTKLGVLGVSNGSFEVCVLALDDRLKVGVLHAGGLPATKRPAEIDAINFAPRVRQPVLMLNGRYDSGYPVELLQKPLFRLLGTPEKDKRHVLVDSGHSVGRSLERARETLDWLDRYLGRVDGQ